MRKTEKLDLKPVIEAGEPVVVVVLTKNGLQKSLVFYESDNPEALQAGNELLARVSTNLVLLDNTLRAASEDQQAAIPGEPQAVEGTDLV